MIIKDGVLKPRQVKDLKDLKDDDDDSSLSLSDVLTDKEIIKVAKRLYGLSFENISELPDIKHLVPVFRDYFYGLYSQYPDITIEQAVQQFITKLPPGVIFHPSPNLLQVWNVQWKENADYMAKIPTVCPDDGYLDSGIRTLAGELLIDAHSTLREASNPAEDITPRDRVGMKRYVTSILQTITTMVHGKARIMLQASSEKRENASFAVDLLQKATSGKLTSEDITLLRESNS
jgi:hypothetical protein